MQLDPNTDLPATIDRSRAVEQFLRTYPGVRNVLLFTDNNYTASFQMVLVPPNERTYTQAELESRIRRDLVRFKRDPLEQFFVGRPGRSQQALQVILTHPDRQVLASYGKTLSDWLATQEGVVDITSNTPPQAEELKVRPNFVMANSLGVSSNEIASTISYLFYGETVGTMNENGRSSDIVARLDLSQTKDPTDLLNASVQGKNGLVPLGSVVEVSKERGDSTITHYNGMREYTVLADYTADDLGGLMRKIENFIPGSAPLGLNFDFGGEAANLKKANAGILFALALSFLFAYMVLCSQFESLLTPFVIILSVPLAFSGAFIALLMFGQSLSLYAMVGLILLTGLVKKNAILLLDFTEQHLRTGMPLEAALALGGKTRLRPIIMTSLAMIGGMLPLALNSAAGHEMRSPMGVAVMGGVVSSTILTLLVIPCIYAMLVQWLRKKKTIIV
jgi:HAE1 family hydrophobic/amphiphilic exporter-1